MSRQDTRVTFDVPLDQTQYEVTAELLDSEDDVLAGAYLVDWNKESTDLLKCFHIDRA